MRRVILVALLPLLCARSRADAPAAPPAAAAAVSDGLDEDAAVLRALTANPTLRAFRKQRQVAEGQIVSAAALQNPIVQLQLVHFQEASALGFTAQVKWVPPQPVEYVARKAQARAYLDQVRYDIAEQEWALGTAVRTLHATVLELREQGRILDEALVLRRRMGALVRTRMQRGGSTRFEQNLADLAILNVQRELDEVAISRAQAEVQLGGLMGAVSETPPTLRGQLLPDPDDASPPLPDAAPLAELALSYRPLMKSAQARISQREQALRIERSRRWPWPELNGRYGQTGSTKYPNDWQVGLQFPVPVLSLNSGPIQVAEAQLDLEHASVEAQIAAIRQSVFAAHAELKQRREILGRHRREVLPVLAEHNRLMDIALHGGQVDLVALLGSEDSVQRGRRDYSGARLAYRRSYLALEAAVGASLKEVAR